MYLAVFHPDTRRVFRGKRGTRSPFGHTFGGSADYSGLRLDAQQPPVHLLFRLNTADPAAGVALPGVTWLPLLCGIRYGACDLGYRVVSDDAVTILHQGEKAAWDDFPTADYPAKLKPRPVTFVEATYDPGDPADALFYAGVFGYGALSADQYARVVRYVEKKEWAEMSGAESAEDYLQTMNCSPFVQGRPNDGCPDPACGNHGREASLRPFAIFEEGRRYVPKLWGSSCGSLQIIYQVCPACGAIRTGNQRT